MDMSNIIPCEQAQAHYREFFERGYSNIMAEQIAAHLRRNRKPKLYLSGKMQGLPDHGFALFNAEAKRLRDLGYEVVNPAENEKCETWEEYMKEDIRNLLLCDMVAVLPNWKDSRGAKFEVLVAQTVKIPVVTAHDMLPLKDETILEEAQRLVGGDRQKDYGHPYDDYKCTVEMFNALMFKKYGKRWLGMGPEDATMFMVCVKLSREMNAPKRDSLVDAAGYLLCYQMVREKMGSEVDMKKVADALVTLSMAENK